MAVIFDIQRSSIHDGPGIRTTVFFKGCPLSCLWCHNPESQIKAPQLAFLHEKCILCGACASVCHNGVHRISGSKHYTEYQKCIACGACVSACPTKALKIYGREASAAEIMQTVEADRSFYDATGGGLTLSGGEPFFQFDALLELLVLAKRAGIHTCVETCGFASTAHINAAAEYTDLFLFDCKESDPKLHKAYTGVDNQLIKDNFLHLYSNGASIIVRCPIIPGYNDNDTHLRSICGLKARYPGLTGVELLLYHDMGRAKAKAIGAEYNVSKGMPTRGYLESLRAHLLELGADKELTDSI